MGGHGVAVHAPTRRRRGSTLAAELGQRGAMCGVGGARAAGAVRVQRQQRVGRARRRAARVVGVQRVRGHAVVVVVVLVWCDVTVGMQELELFLRAFPHHLFTDVLPRQVPVVFVELEKGIVDDQGLASGSNGV